MSTFKNRMIVNTKEGGNNDGGDVWTDDTVVISGGKK